jgi:hypothetical protein
MAVDAATAGAASTARRRRPASSTRLTLAMPARPVVVSSRSAARVLRSIGLVLAVKRLRHPGGDTAGDVADINAPTQQHGEKQCCGTGAQVDTPAHLASPPTELGHDRGDLQLIIGHLLRQHEPAGVIDRRDVMVGLADVDADPDGAHGHRLSARRYGFRLIRPSSRCPQLHSRRWFANSLSAQERRNGRCRGGPTPSWPWTAASHTQIEPDPPGLPSRTLSIDARDLWRSGL